MCKVPECRRHNGWTNYETWCVNLWMDNDQGAQRYWAGEAGRAANQDDPVGWLADLIREEHETAAQGMYQAAHQTGPLVDLLNAALSEVNWREIAQFWIDDYTDEG